MRDPWQNLVGTVCLSSCTTSPCSSWMDTQWLLVLGRKGEKKARFFLWSCMKNISF